MKYFCKRSTNKNFSLESVIFRSTANYHTITLTIRKVLNLQREFPSPFFPKISLQTKRIQNLHTIIGRTPELKNLGVKDHIPIRKSPSLVSSQPLSTNNKIPFFPMDSFRNQDDLVGRVGVLKEEYLAMTLGVGSRLNSRRN